MIPAANLLGFAGQEFARKMPKVAGILIETTFGSIVEIILFVVLIVQHEPQVGTNEEGSADGGNLIPIIQAAILGSILTNLLLCLGLCFFFSGMRRHEQNQKFHAVVSEVGSGLLLVAAFGLLIPSAFYSALKSETVSVLRQRLTRGRLEEDILDISRSTAIVLIIAYALYVLYCCTSAHSIFDEVIEMDEHRDADREQDAQKPKLTLTETFIAIAISILLVAWLLIILVGEIEEVVGAGVPDQFLGLILLPLVEKAAEHLTAIDEAWDGVINVALFHCIGPSIQTALFNGPLVVLVAWILGKPMDLNFEIFMIALLLLSILVVGNFLRDQESNWLEGALLVVSSSERHPDVELNLLTHVDCLCHHRYRFILLPEPGCSDIERLRECSGQECHNSSPLVQGIISVGPIDTVALRLCACMLFCVKVAVAFCGQNLIC